jgi:Lantibiotic dehydratase, N terminus
LFWVDRHLVSLAGDWALWRDFAVRSAGFAVGGLDVFGGEGESARLGAVAADPMFGEAVIWQNRSAYRTAVAKIAGRGAEPGSKRRQRDGVVAGYWQRYCSKNDTVGFFGPLAWGAIRDHGPAVAVRSRGLVAERVVHFESWCLEALARAIGTPAVVPLNRRPEVELRMQLEAFGDEEGLRALDRLEAARAEVAAAPGPEQLLAALDAFDACLEKLTGEPPAPSEEGAEGGRTPLYLDCMRDLTSISARPWWPSWRGRCRCCLRRRAGGAGEASRMPARSSAMVSPTDRLNRCLTGCSTRCGSCRGS